MPADAPAGIARSAHYFPELECLRGVAIALVVLFHADCLVRFPFGNTIGMWPEPPLSLVLGGHTGVSLFFILSGFLLGLPFLAEAEGGRRVDRTVYYRKRALRILPLYWATLAVGVLVTVRTPAELWSRLGYFVFADGMAEVVRPMQPFTDVVWSLATEAQFYLVLPLLPWVLGSRRRLGVAAIAYAGAYVLFLAGAAGRWSMPVEGFLARGVFGRLPQFALGIGAAWVHRRFGPRLGRGRWLGRGRGDLLLVGCVLALAFLLQPVVYRGYHVWNMPPLHVWHVVEGVLWTIILLLVLDASLVVRPLLVNAPLARLGVLSYSIYLVHMPFYWYSLHLTRTLYRLPARWTAGNAVWLVAALPAIVVVSAITYRWIERPFLERKASVGERR